MQSVGAHTILKSHIVHFFDFSSVYYKHPCACEACIAVWNVVDHVALSLNFFS